MTGVYPSEASLWQLFADQAETRPDAVAVEYGAELLDYGELAHRARRIAAALQTAGVERGDRIGLYLERSPALIESMLGILAAGGAYVPLDLDYPAERIAFMIEDADVSVVVTAASELPGGIEATVLALSQVPAIAAAPSELPSIGGADLGCVIYTSGSTGRPKGVSVPQRAVSRLVLGTDYLQIVPGDRVGQVSNASFDAATFEIWSALLNGGRLVGLERQLSLDADQLATELRSRRVDSLLHTTAPFNHIVHQNPTTYSSLRDLMIGAEAAVPRVVRRVLDTASPQRLLNLYGPTEATTLATWHPVTEVPDDATTIPIGRPIANTAAYIVDEHLKPVPGGVAGELLLGGDGLAHGYFAKPALSAERFVPNPFGDGERLYRTGDRVRSRDDDNIEFLGRVDNQVKLRGFRIELGEIEATLAQHPEVDSATVLLREDEPGDKHLVAYIIGRPGSSPEDVLLRTFLEDRLPNFMLPSAYVFLDALPLTPNGKVDRNALPVPPKVRSTTSEEAALATPLERQLAEIVSELLGLEEVGIHENLFTLGAHSLLAARLITRLRRELNQELSVTELFAHPTVAELAESIEGKAGQPRAESLNLVQVDRSAGLPLSFPQERIWFLEQLAPGNIAYNFQAQIELDGPLDPHLCQRSLSEIVRRHEIFRTRFAAVNGQPVQVVTPPFSVELPVIDLGAIPREEAERRIERAVAIDVRRPFDILQLPLIRWRLFRLADERWVLFQMEHHFVHDGWSFSVYLREFKEIYQAFAAGRPSPLPELRIQFGDYVAWHRRRMQGEVLEECQNYWLRRLQGSPQTLELPTDHPRPPVLRYRGGMVQVELPLDLARRARERSRALGVTLFNTMKAAFDVLLYRYTGQTDLLVGTGAANRRWPETEGLLGMLVNSLILRSDLAGNPSFEQLAKVSREAFRRDWVYEDVRLDLLVEKLAPERDLSRNPLFQVTFSFHDSPEPDLEFAGLRGVPRMLHNGSAKADFNVVVIPRAEQRVGREPRPEQEWIRLHWEYSTDLFERSTVERIASHYLNLLADAVQHPEKEISNLTLLSAEERREVVVDWNQTAQPYPAEASLWRLFADQAAARTDAVAVEYDAEQLSYGKLAHRARRLAATLKAAGVERGDCVGLYLERSAPLIEAILGILAADAAYVPLDPDYPEERLGFMIGDTGLSVVVTDADELPATFGATALNLSQLSAAELTHPPVSDGSDLAYVIYTSGSTGRPKGVAVPQHAVARLVLGSDYLQLATSDRVAQASTFSFDAATFEIWSALLNGGRLVGLERQKTLDAESLDSELRGRRIDSLFTTTALFNQIVQQDPTAYASLRDLLFGGEAVDTRAVRRVALAAPPKRLLHVYGPTEVTTFATWTSVTEISDGAITVPIGRPIANTTAYVVDERLRPLPVGVPGELLLGADGLARGYFARPALSAERFVPNPFGDGERLYRTGDRVRTRHNGAIEFLGRVDHQVKLRGFRIELGEIEANLSQHPELSAAAVLLREDRPGDKRLVAYVATSTDADDLPLQLRTFLNERLPSFMMPHVFVALDTLPLTPGGKVDRSSLPLPEAFAGEEDGGEHYVAPRTPTEEVLAAIWEGLLGSSRVGLHDDFFDLGGHSLLAMQVISRARQAFDVELPLEVLFESPTVARLAARVKATLNTKADTLPALQPQPANTEPVLSFAQVRLWFLDRLEGPTSRYNVPVGIRLRGALRTAALTDSLNTVVDRHEPLRAYFPEVGGHPRLTIVEQLRLRLSSIDLRGLSPAVAEIEREQLLLDAFTRSFDLERGPLVRAYLLRLADDDHVLFLNMHHIVTDGWSIGVLVREVAALYAAKIDGRPSPLAPLPIRYADFAAWQRHWFEGDFLDQHLGFWRQQLAGSPPLLEVPTDRPRREDSTAPGAWETVVYPVARTAELNHLAIAEDSTQFMTLLAGFQALLSRYSRQQDLTVGTPVSGRNRLEVENLIGFFVNLLVLRTDLTGDPNFRQLLRRVRRTTVTAFAHQDVPFEQVVEALKPPRSLARTPLFQAMFVLQEPALSELRMQGLEVEPVVVIPVEAKYDLNLAVTPRREGLVAAMEYNTDLFDRVTIHRFLGHLGALFEAVVENPETRLSRIPLLTPAERSELAANMNVAQPLADGARPDAVAAFEAQVQRSPTAPALMARDRSLAFEDVDCSANRLARFLLDNGIGPEQTVGLAGERTPELAIALLAIFKAGAVALPLDSRLPGERFDFIVADSGVAAILGSAPQMSERDDNTDSIVLLPFPSKEDLARYSSESLELVRQPEQLAYIIYTSGSTGAPKGVGVSHGALGRQLAFGPRYYRFSPQDRLLHTASFSFDVAFEDLLAPLTVGAAVIFSDPDLPAPAQLLADIRHRGVTAVDLTPAYWAQILDEVEKHDTTGLEELTTVIVGGEALPPSAVERWCRLAPPTQRLLNAYGPTEAVITTTIYEVDRRRADIGWPRTPIGQVFGDRLLVVTDPGGEPTPVGVPGELAIGGQFLARGYHARPRETANNFRPDTFSHTAGTRLYRTGDLVRTRGDGDLEFLGRIDHQIKLRGFRIELGEIEAVLCLHREVNECAILLREDTPGNPRLVAYLIVARGQQPADDLRAFLAAQLPDYMVPSVFVGLPSLPLTANGKIDRQALPLPEDVTSQTTERIPKPSTSPFGELVAAIFSDVLSAGEVRLDADFFDLGGHSLLATQVISRVKRALGVGLPLRALFENPTPEALGQKIADARSDGRSDGHARREPPLLISVGRQRPTVLSFAQQRLWFLEQLQGEPGLYNFPVVLELDGALDAEALAASLHAIIRRHEALRTTFPATDGKPTQRILERIQLSLGPIEDAGNATEERLTAEASRPFDLATGPLIRSRLFRIGPDRHLLLLTLHHIICDGWSLAVLNRELMTLYDAFCSGRPNPLEELPAQYADFAAWQRRWLSGEVLDGQLGYWSQRLAAMPPLLEMPTDRPRPAVRTFRGANQELSLPSELASRLVAFSRQRDVTLFMTLLATFQTLLMRHSGQTDIVVGTGIANRNRAEIEDLIGFFVNTLLMRGDLSGRPSFLTLLDRVREAALGAYEHQDLPFELLVEHLQPERSLSHSPLAQVFFLLQNAPLGDPRIPGLEVRPREIDTHTSKFDLSLSLIETETGLEGSLVYRSDLFDHTTVSRLLNQFTVLLRSAVAGPRRSIVDLAMLSNEERHQALVEWNDTTAPTLATTLQHRFAAQAAMAPDHIAAVFGAHTLSYGELERRTEHLARHLCQLGAGPETPVALAVERSLELVVGVLAVLKTGGAWVPMDPALPEERLAYILEDSGARLILTQLQSQLPPFWEGTGVSTVYLDAEPSDAEDNNSPAPLPQVSENNLAYVIYTSGSTGRPKGAGLTHRGLANLCSAQGAAFGVGSSDRVLQFSALSFDASVFEIAMALPAGATLCLAERFELLPGPDLIGLLKDLRITAVTLTPTAVAALPVGELPALRTMVVAGEAFPPDLARRWGTGRRLVNAYGPTEATVWATACTYRTGSETLPIGLPIQGVVANVTDASLKATPIGVAGELTLTGHGLARGYLGLPAKTASAFVPSAWGTEPGARLYRTGDRVQRLSDGAFEFLGRIDYQVKLRGFRIELGEIESVLADHHEIEQCAVVLREDGSGDKLLVAFLTAAFDPPPTVEELRAFLQAQLPEYMVPGRFVPLPELPLNPSGKIDRNALPDPDRLVDEGADYTPPSNLTEEVVASIWAEILGCERVGAGANFFDLGGHSLLATQVVARLRRAFNVEIPLRTLFQHPSLEDLAARIDAETVADRPAASAPPIRAARRDGEIPLSFAQRRLWFLDQLLPGTSHYNIPAFFRLEGHLDLAALEATASALLLRHEALRTRFPEVGGVATQVISEPAPVALPLVDLGGIAETERGNEVERLLRREAERPFDLVAGPVTRWHVVRLGAEEHVLLLTLHHIVFDGWSMGVLVRELDALYRAAVEGEQCALSAPTVQYADFSIWQHEWLSGDHLQELIGYWIEKLGGAPPVLELPTDHPRPPVPTFHGATAAERWSQELVEGLQKLSRRESSTLYMVLLTGLKALLTRYTGLTDISVASPIANRSRPEIENLIGFFVNTLVMRTDLGGDIDFDEALDRVREVALGAFGHQDVPFEQVVEVMQPERTLSHSPLFQVMFVLQNATSDSMRLHGLEVTPLASRSETARFDLTLVVTEQTTGELQVMLEYSTDLFEHATICRLLDHYRRLLEVVVADPEQSLWEADMLAPHERNQLLAEWSGKQTDYPSSATVGQLLAEQAGERSDAIAVVFDDEHLTYSELVRRAAALASSLRQTGLRPGAVVGLLTDRSLELVVALAGILQSGAAYLPLDPSYPEERLAFMLEDAGVEVLVAQPPLLKGLPAEGLTVLALEPGTATAPSDTASRHKEEPAALSTQQLHTAPESLAYVMYTSGSTGRPKGVGVPHRAVVRLVRDTDYVRLDAGEVILQLAPISFDASTLEIWGCLLNGGRLAVAPPVAPTLSELGNSLQRHRVSTLWLTAPLFHQMVDAEPEALAGVRQILAGGDVLSLPHSRRALEAGVERLINGYGPTENTTFTCCFGMDHVDDAWTTIPIGRPIANTSVYVLDAHGLPVPHGVPGELYTGGDGLAWGYWDRPAHTAARFVPDPFASDGRLYRTGDRVRWTTAGTVEFLGRVDHQIKLRGFRIELGEIEVCLAQHPQVEECAVVLREDTPSEKRLIAYVVATSEPPPSASALRSFVKEHLPGYMVPAIALLLPELPLNPNGKIDRAALPAPEDLTAETGIVPPQTPIEEVVAGIWGDVLGVDAVGRSSDFFDLGGHSLQATRVTSRLRRAFGINVPLRTLFEGATVASLATLVESSRIEGKPSAPPILPVSRDSHMPLSFAQQRLWFLDQLEPDSIHYNVPAVFRMVGRLDRSALAATLDALVQRHEVLRTRFPAIEGRPVQEVQEISAELPLIDLSSLAEPQRDAQVQHLCRTENTRPFDLLNGPVLRLRLLALGPEEHLLQLSLHHIVADLWSMEALVSELRELYQGLLEDRPINLPDLPVQYADFATWQRKWLASDLSKELTAYWLEHLRDMASLVELPADRPRPTSRSLRGAIERAALPTDLSDDLRRFARQEDVTLYMTLLAGFQLLIARYTGQWDVSVAAPIANRHRPEIENLIGFFVNTLVMRADLSGQPSFQETVARVRETALGAYAHQDLPFERLVELLQPERALSHTPLVQVMFVHQSSQATALELSGLEISSLPQRTDTAKFDLTVVVDEDSDQLQTVEVEYSTDLFDPGTIRRLIDAFRVLLTGAMADPEMPTGYLPLLSATERRKIVEGWNQTQRSYPSESSLWSLFSEQAAARPDAVAIEYGADQLSYGELARRARRLASELQASGVERGHCVGVYLERSLALAEAVVGILAAGGAYVPLDPEYPAERLDFMIEDTGLAMVITATNELPVGIVAAEINLHRLSDATPEATEMVSDGDDIAYVIYTSGSTGHPKGVTVPQHAVARLLLGTDFLQLAPGDRVAQASTTSFDAATFEIWGALLNGGRLIGLERQVTLEAKHLAEDLRRRRVDSLFTTTALFNQIVRQDSTAYGSLRDLLFGGEAVDPNAVRQVLAGSPPQRLLHVYGPTEVTTFATWHLVTEVPAAATTVTIGHPIGNTTAYITDERLQPLPIGVPGELQLGGDGLSRGYFARPALSAERFVPNPFADSERLYRTGDRVRSRQDGTIEFLGRVDHQIKLRGFRIELGEIEALLAQHPEIDAATVLLREDRPGDKRLVAYVVAHPDLPLLADQLQAFLGEQLPQFMIPGFFVSLDSLPLTANGKIDRSALVAPEDLQLLAEGDLAPPQTPVEEAVSTIWEEVLQRNRIGRNANFFDLGGHSLLATQVVSRVRQTFQIDLPIAEIFESQTVKGLAARISEALPTADTLVAPPIRRRARGERLPLSFAQQRLWFLDQLQPDSDQYNIPAFFRVQGLLDTTAFEAALREIVRRHEVLRTRFLRVDGTPEQIIDETSDFVVERADLTDMPPEQREVEVRRLARKEAKQPFDLATDPVLRAKLLSLSDDEHALFLTVHHIAADGWSLGILMRELTPLYEAFRRNEPSPLPELTLQYADFSVWQRKWLSDTVLDRQLDYWRQRLDGAPPALDLPADRPRQAQPTLAGGREPLEIPKQLAGQIKEFARTRNATLFMTLLAAFKTLLMRYSGVDDIVVGTPVANRNRVETDGLIGFFVNTLVLRSDLGDNPSFLQLLERVREVTLSAYAHQDLPFERLVEELVPARDLSRTPLFQVMFVVQNTSPIATELADLNLTPMPIKGDSSKFDLTLSVAETEDTITALAEYSRDLFDPPTIRRLLQSFRILLEGIVENPEARLADLPLLEPSERARLLAAGGPAFETTPSGVSLGTLFARQAAADPERVAMVSADDSWTYGDVDSQSTGLAQLLKELVQ